MSDPAMTEAMRILRLSRDLASQNYAAQNDPPMWAHLRKDALAELIADALRDGVREPNQGCFLCFVAGMILGTQLAWLGWVLGAILC
ncbi:MAG: hypothetical protein ACREDY_20415 [Bradyrhizobium sp.]